MANPQKENGFTSIANELIESFQRLHLSGNQWCLLWTIIRLTYGWNKKVDHISLSMFEQCTGLNRWNLKRDLNNLFKRGVIIKDSSGYMIGYGLQKDYTKWQTSIKNNTSIKNDTATSIKNDTHKRTKTIKYSPNSNEVRMSELLFNLILERHPTHSKPDMQKWALHVDKMIRLDNRSVEDIERIIKWCQGDGFWRTAVLSTEKLRKQFDTLCLKAGLGETKKSYDEIGFEERKN